MRAATSAEREATAQLAEREKGFSLSPASLGSRSLFTRQIEFE